MRTQRSTLRGGNTVEEKRILPLNSDGMIFVTIIHYILKDRLLTDWFFINNWN